jgi:hypothetical protein
MLEAGGRHRERNGARKIKPVDIAGPSAHALLGLSGTRLHSRRPTVTLLLDLWVELHKAGQ